MNAFLGLGTECYKLQTSGVHKTRESHRVHPTKRRIRLMVVVAILPCLAVLAGCDAQSATKNDTANAADPIPQNARAISNATPREGAKPLSKLPADAAFEIRWNNERIGTAFATWKLDDTKQMVRVEQKVKLSVLRFGQSSSLDLHITCWETPSGALTSFERRLNLGDRPIVSKGQIDKGRLSIITEGTPRAVSKPWPDEALGPMGVERLLVSKPLKAGDSLTALVLDPTRLELDKLQLTARHVTVANVDSKLVEIELIKQSDGATGPEKSLIWIDDEGEIQRSQDAIGVSMVRMPSSAQAIETVNASVDVGRLSSIPLNKKIPSPHAKSSITFRVYPKSDDDLFLPPELAPAQTVEKLTDGSYRLTIRREKENVPVVATPTPDAAYLEPSDWIESDDPIIQQLSKEALAKGASGAAIGPALETFVHKRMTRRNFSQVFASAADVAKSSEGDCTEHSVLLAALGRAAGVPSRVAAGLVYFEAPEPALGFHMWNELFLEGAWRSYDATLGLGGVGPTHIKLSHQYSHQTSPFDSYHILQSWLGKIDVEVESFE